VTWATKPWPPPWFAGQGVEGPGDSPSAGEAPEGR